VTIFNSVCLYGLVALLRQAIITSEMEEFIQDFLKLQRIIERLRENVERKLSNKEEYIVHLENQIKKLHEELREIRVENESLRQIHSAPIFGNPAD